MDRPVKIIAGHYGSGKTVFAVNYALSLKDKGFRVMLADIDIVNPYFCAREKKDFFEQKGIHVIYSAGGIQSDLPALSPEIMRLFEEPGLVGVLDAGGDAAGARVLARFSDKITSAGYELLFTLNTNRPETARAELAAEYITQIENSSGLKVTGLVNVTHLLDETTKDEILKGAALCAEVSARCGIPVRFHGVDEKFVHSLSGELHEEILPLRIYMNKPWEI